MVQNSVTYYAIHLPHYFGLPCAEVPGFGAQATLASSKGCRTASPAHKTFVGDRWDWDWRGMSAHSNRRSRVADRVQNDDRRPPEMSAERHIRVRAANRIAG